MTTIYQSETNNNFNPIETTTTLNTSDKYKQVNSSKLIEVFNDNGLQLKGTSFGKPRKEERKGFQKHIMIFENDSFNIDNDNKLQLLVTNSHDGSSSLKLNIGVFRFVCANGLVSGSDYFQQRVLHKGQNFQENLDYSIQEILRKMPLVADQVTKMRQTKLEIEQIREFKYYAANLKLNGIDNLLNIRTDTIGKVRRVADQASDLYTVFNRIQETVIRGGIKYKTYDTENNKIKNNTTREVKAITAKTELNKQLWNYATKLVA